MHSLRHLVVDRSDLYVLRNLYDLDRTVEVVKLLPATMKSIVLLYNDSSELFFPCGAEEPLIPLNSTFPSLQCLILDTARVWTPSMVTQLPSSLTDLSFRIPAGDTALIRDLMQALPPTLARLDLRCHDDSQIHHSFLLPLLPSNLVSASINMDASPSYNFLGPILAFEAGELDLLPRSLMQFSCSRVPRSIPPFIRAMLDLDFPTTPIKIEWTDDARDDSLPPFLSSANFVVRDPKRLQAALKALPLHVESLDLYESNFLDDKLIQALPRRLTRLDGALRISSDIKSTDFPPQLTSMKATMIKPLKPKTAARLPPLVDLHLHMPVKACVVSHLPRTITRLRVELEDLDGVSELLWPPHLRTLHCVGSASLTTFGHGIDPKKAKKIKFDSKHPLTTLSPSFPCCILKSIVLAPLPRGLTSLNIGKFGIASSELLHLPPFLTKLRLDFVFNDAQFDPSSATALSRARELLRFEPSGAADYDFCLFAPQPTIAVFDLIPRTVTDLSYVGDTTVPPIAWSRLPTSLTFLHVSPDQSVPSGEILLHIPKLHLKTLSFGAIEATSDHIKALLPLMKRAVLALQNSPAPSAEAAMQAPLCLTLHGAGMSVSPLSLAIHDRLIAISNAAEKRDFQALKDLQPPYPPL